jgi:hypothetical protein
VNAFSLRFVPVNQAWVWFFGDTPIRIQDYPMFYPTREDADWVWRMLMSPTWSEEQQRFNADHLLDSYAEQHDTSAC